VNLKNISLVLFDVPDFGGFIAGFKLNTTLKLLVQKGVDINNYYSEFGRSYDIPGVVDHKIPGDHNAPIDYIIKHIEELEQILQ
jgi:hypothetical protein